MPYKKILRTRTETCYLPGCSLAVSSAHTPYCSLAHREEARAAERTKARRTCVQCGKSILGAPIFNLFCERPADCIDQWNAAHPVDVKADTRVRRETNARVNRAEAARRRLEVE